MKHSNPGVGVGKKAEETNFTGEQLEEYTEPNVNQPKQMAEKPASQPHETVIS